MKLKGNILKYVERAIIGISTAHIIYFGVPAALSLVTSSVAPKIKNKSHLEQMLKEEKKKLNLGDDIKIVVELKDNNKGFSYAKKTGKNQYFINLKKNSHNLHVLKHELYHIADGHCDAEKMNLLRFFYIEEPQAIFYSSFGKLRK